MNGFFSRSELSVVKDPKVGMPKCGSCGLFKTCESPKMPVWGGGHKRVMIVGEAPGRQEDEKGVPFYGEAGQLLQRVLRRMGVDFKEDCWVTNSLICRPPKNKIKNQRMIEWCRPNVLRAIQQYKPDVIIPLGKTAVKSVLGLIWKEDVGPMIRWAGWKIPCQHYNAWVCPTWHPSFLLRQEKQNPLLDRLFESHLKAAFRLRGKPWVTPPNYGQRVRVEYDPDLAARFIRIMIHLGLPVAIDYETDRLKPDHSDRRIITSALSNGAQTIAYPWHGAAITATKELIESDVPKIAAKMGFEIRWTKRVLGVWGRRWDHDVIATAHTLDNRRGVSSVKFQALVQLGQEDYSSHIDRYKLSDSGNIPNKMRDVPLPDVLLYNGLDALLEWEIWRKQKEVLNGGKEIKHRSGKTRNPMGR